MAEFEFVEWLLLWLHETSYFEFDWDKGNQTKSWRKHAVTTNETEEIFLSGQAAPLGIQVKPKVPEERLGIVGPTLEGRILHVVFTLRAGEVRPISTRPAHKMRGTFMKHTYAKSRREYKSTSIFDKNKILQAAKRLKKRRKIPTSIALEEKTIKELKALAEWRGVPYQVLMRMFILDGLHKSMSAGAR